MWRFLDCFAKNSPKEKQRKVQGRQRKTKGKKEKKRKGEAKKDVRVRGKKKERKVLFGSVCGSHKTVEIIE